ncbi:MAG: restriction endonuclease subunit S [Nitrosomonas sp.]|nr:restriction endonuclease subunit S [Nitrosomonas sp.]
MSEWRECMLGELVESISETYKFKPHEQVVFLNTSDILFGKVTNRLLQDSSNLPGQAKKRITKGDLLFSEIRPANGRYAVIDFNAENYVVSTKLMVLRCNDGIDKDYFRIFLTSEEQLDYLQLLAEDRSGTFPQITFDHISSINISLPPLPEQKAIASVLSSLDDKIDLLHRQNKTLETMAETLFRQWFVEEAGEDWEEVTLNDVTNRITDGAHASPATVEIGLPMASVKDMFEWGIKTESCRQISQNDYDELIRTDCRPLKNDILIAKDGSYLKHVFVAENDMDVVVLSSIAILRPNGKYHPLLLATFLKLDSTRESMENIVTGAVIPRIVLKDFRNYKLLLPPKQIQEQALVAIEPLFKKCWENCRQIRTLEILRDTLLPKLMSGEVRVDYP